MGHAIEAAKSGRSRCATCGAPIDKGDLRLAEAYVSVEGRGARELRNARHAQRPSAFSSDRPYFQPAGPDVWARHHHLPCAATAQPYKLKSALAATALEIPDRDALEQAIVRALAVGDASEDNEQTRDEYLHFLDIIRDAPDDEHLLVFGDWLQSVGDPRGELVAVQLGLETATGETKLELADREKKLLAVHSKHLRPEKFDGTLTWRRGFVHRITINALDPAIARVLAHPSLRVVRELVVDISSTWTNIVVAANLPRPLPSTLRTIELRVRGTSVGLGAIAPVLESALPQLQRLALDGPADLVGLAHPTLAELELVSADAAAPVIASRGDEPRPLVDRLGELEGKKLPALSRLVLRIDHGLDAAIAALAASGLFRGVRELVAHGDLSKAGLAPLRKRHVTLERLDVRRTLLAPTDLDALRPLAKNIVLDEPPAAPTAPAPPPTPREWRVRHTRRPEWGIGRVVEETEAGLLVEFEAAGSKLVRNVELLEDVS